MKLMVQDENELKKAREVIKALTSLSIVFDKSSRDPIYIVFEGESGLAETLPVKRGKNLRTDDFLDIEILEDLYSMEYEIE